MSDAEALGQRLREAREAKDLTLDDVEHAIRIRGRFLEALERGDYSIMTSVQAQGFLRNYARFLGLDFELLLSELDVEKSRSRWKRRNQQPALSSEPPATAARSSAVRRLVTPVEQPRPAQTQRQRTRKSRSLAGNISIVLIAGAVVVGVVFGGTLLFNQLTDSPDENQPLAETIPSQTPSEGVETPANETVSPSPDDTVATPAETPVGGYTPPALTGTSVIVSIQVLQRTWLRVTVDGEVTREGLARPGEVWQFEGTQSVGVRANNAAALDLTVNNQPQGTLGARGQLFDYTYSLPGGGAVVPNTTIEAVAEPPTEAVVQAPSVTATQVLFQPPNFTPIASPQPMTATSPPPTAAVTLPLLDGIPSSIPGQASGGVTQPAIAGATAILVTGATAIPLPLSETDTPTPTIATATEPSSAPTLIRSATPTLSPTVTLTPSDTLTPTSTPSLTRTPSLTPTPTFTVTPSPTMTPTPTLTPSQTPFLPPRFTRTPSPPPK